MFKDDEIIEYVFPGDYGVLYKVLRDYNQEESYNLFVKVDDYSEWQEAADKNRAKILTNIIFKMMVSISRSR